MIKTSWAYDTTKLDLLITMYGSVADEAIRKTGDSIVADIKSKWSSSAPSDPYNAPAVVSGKLNKSVRLLRRDASGRFATTQNAKYWSVFVGTDYAAALEFGYAPRNLLPRPYLRPAIARAQKELTKNLVAALGILVAGAFLPTLNFFGNDIEFGSPDEDDLG